MNIVFIILISLFILIFLSDVFLLNKLESFKSGYYRKGLTIFMKKLPINLEIYEKNILPKYFGNVIVKEDIIIKILDKNSLFFCVKYYKGIFSSKIEPIIYGECNFEENIVKIKYKISYHFIPLLLIFILTIILNIIFKVKDFSFVIILMLFLFGWWIILFLFKIKAVKMDIEWFLKNG